MDQSEVFDVDKIINKLLEVKGVKQLKPVNIPEKQVKALCTKAMNIFLSQPMLLELEAPLKICGLFLLLENKLQATCMDNTWTCSGSSNMAAFRLNRTTFSSEITLIAASKASKLFAYFSPTR